MTFFGGYIAPALLVPAADLNMSDLQQSNITITGYAPLVDNIGAQPLWFTNNQSPVLALGNTNSVPLAGRTITRDQFGSPSAGKLLVAFWGHAGYTGESLGSLREADGFQFWGENLNGTFWHQSTDTNERTCRMDFRVSTGDQFDDCVIFSNGPFPTFLTIREFVPVNPNDIQPSSSWWNASNTAESTGLDMIAAPLNVGPNRTESLIFWCSTKRATGLEGSEPINIGQGCIDVARDTTPDNGFGQACKFAAGYRINGPEGIPADIAQDDWMPAIGYTERSFGATLHMRGTESGANP